MTVGNRKAADVLLLGATKGLNKEKVPCMPQTISTSLKILVMGDSVGIQFAQGFEEAAGATHGHRSVLRY